MRRKNYMTEHIIVKLRKIEVLYNKGSTLARRRTDTLHISIYSVIIVI
jgi:hypothetical protein